MSRYLDPKSDVVFNKIFGEHPALLKSFLNAVLPLPEDGLIQSLEYLSPKQAPRIPVLKTTIVDVKCKDEQGRSFVVEMQLQWTNSFMQRMLFGTSQAYIKQLEKGEDYSFLNPVYGLGIIGTIFDEASSDWYHHYKLVNIQRPEQEIKGLQIVFLELPKFKPKTRDEKKLRALWLRFLSEIDEHTQSVDAALLAVPEIKQAIDLSEEASYTPQELEAIDRYWDTVSREKTLMTGKYAQGKAEGRVEGEAIGLQKGEALGLQKGEAIGLQKGEALGLQKVAQNMLSQGLSLETIVLVTGLPIEQIQILQHQK